MVIPVVLLFAAQVEMAIRSEVPIREVVLGDGTRRYAVPISIGGQTVEAGLDSGSVGLRALRDAAAAAKKTGDDQSYQYGVGTELVGPQAQAPVTIGALTKTISIQAVRAVACAASRPNCPASRLSLTQFGIQGNGMPGEGFRAILGTGLAAARLPNPLVALGTHRWMIELPLSGDGRPGRLVLNPSDGELAGFVPLELWNPHRDRRNDALRGCLGRPSNAWELCAPTLIDTGAPGIEVVNDAAPAWPDGSAGYFKLQSANANSVSIRFTSGQRKQASHLMFVRDERVQGPVIRSGLIIFLAYAVLYDADRDSIAVRPRPPYPGGPASSH